MTYYPRISAYGGVQHRSPNSARNGTALNSASHVFWPRRGGQQQTVAGGIHLMGTSPSSPALSCRFSCSAILVPSLPLYSTKVDFSIALSIPIHCVLYATSLPICIPHSCCLVNDSQRLFTRKPWLQRMSCLPPIFLRTILAVRRF